MKAKHFDESKIATQIMAEVTNIVTCQDYAELVYSWYRGNAIKIMHVKRYVFVIFFFKENLIYSLIFAHIDSFY